MRGAINTSTGARGGRVKVSLYKINKGNAVEGGSGLSILEEFSSGFFLAGQPLLKFYSAVWPLIIIVDAH